jgi:antitoxin CcdA
MEDIMNKPAKIDGTKKPTNVTLSQNLVAEAKRLGINLSQACERGLRDQVAETAAHKWQQDNKAAIAASNAFAEQNDLPLAGQRLF